MEMSSKSLNTGEPEFKGKFQAININLKVFIVRIIIKTMGMDDFI